MNNASTSGLFIVEWPYTCGAGYRCEWEILLYASSGQLSNFSLQLALLDASPVFTLIPLNTATAVSLSGQQYSHTAQFVLTQLCVVNLTIRATNTSTAIDATVSRSDRPSDFSFTFDLREGLTDSVLFSPASAYYFSNQSNVGSPFVAAYRLALQTQYYPPDANLTITVATSPYTGPTYVLQPQMLNLSQPFVQRIDVELQQTRWYYGCTAPPALSSTDDFIFSVMALNVSTDGYSGGLSVWWSDVYPLPSDIGYAFNDSCSNSLPLATCIFSATNGNALRPGQSIYFGVRWDANTYAQLQVSGLCNAMPRLTLTAQGSTGWQAAVPQGYAAVVDLQLPSPSTASYLSFVAGVATASPPPIAPLLLSTSSLLGGTPSELPDWSQYGRDGGFQNQQPLLLTPGAYTAGSYLRRTADLCVPSSYGCLYHFLVFFPLATTGWQLTVSGLSISSPQARLPVNATVLQLNSATGPLSVGVGQVALFNFSLPPQLLTTAQLTVALTPLDSGNADLFLACINGPGFGFVEALPSNDRAPTPQLRLFGQSINATGPDSIFVNASDPRFAIVTSAPTTFLVTQWQIAVVGTSAATFSLSLTQSGSPPANATLGYLALTPQQNGSANVTLPRTPSALLLYTMVLPPSYTNTSDLLVSILANRSGSNPSVSLTVYAYWPALEQYTYIYFPASGWLRASGRGGVSLMINSVTWPSVGPGSVLYLQLAVPSNAPITLVPSPPAARVPVAGSGSERLPRSRCCAHLQLQPTGGQQRRLILHQRVVPGRRVHHQRCAGRRCVAPVADGDARGQVRGCHLQPLRYQHGHRLQQPGVGVRRADGDGQRRVHHQPVHLDGHAVRADALHLHVRVQRRARSSAHHTRPPSDPLGGAAHRHHGLLPAVAASPAHVGHLLPGVGRRLQRRLLRVARLPQPRPHPHLAAGDHQLYRRLRNGHPQPSHSAPRSGHHQRHVVPVGVRADAGLLHAAGGGAGRRRASVVHHQRPAGEQLCGPGHQRLLPVQHRPGQRQHRPVAGTEQQRIRSPAAVAVRHLLLHAPRAPGGRLPALLPPLRDVLHQRHQQRAAAADADSGAVQQQRAATGRAVVAVRGGVGRRGQQQHLAGRGQLLAVRHTQHAHLPRPHPSLHQRHADARGRGRAVLPVVLPADQRARAAGAAGGDGADLRGQRIAQRVHHRPQPQRAGGPHRLVRLVLHLRAAARRLHPCHLLGPTQRTDERAVRGLRAPSLAPAPAPTRAWCTGRRPCPATPSR